MLLYKVNIFSSQSIPQANHMDFPIPSQERIDQIASWLSETPGHFGPTAADRAAWLPYADTPEAKKIIAQAESVVGTPIPELPDELYLQFLRIGNRSNYERVYFQRQRDRLFPLVQAEVLEYKGRFLEAIEKELNAFFNEKSWVLPAHDGDLWNFNGTAPYADLFCSDFCATLAIYDWWLQDKLQPTTRKRIREEVERRMFAAYRHVIRTGEITRGQWWTVGGNNWNSVCHSQLVIAAMILMEDRHDRAEILAAVEKAMPFFTAGYSADGYCTEGMGYWGYGYGRFLILAETVLMMTGGKLSLYDNETLHNVAAFARDIQIEENCCPAFADCGVGISPSPDDIAIIQYRYPDAVLRAVPPRTEVTGVPMLTVIRCFDKRPYPPAGVPLDGQLPPRKLYPLANIYVGRSTLNGRHFGVAFKTGHNAEEHNHNDIGSFTVVLNKHQFFLDPGGEPYTKRTFSPQRYEGQMLNSFGHMVPIVEGKLQSPGRQSHGTFISTDFTDDVDTIVADIAPAYPEAKELVSLKRTFTFNRKEQTLTVRDDVEFTSPQTFETALVSYDELTVNGSTVIASYQNAAVSATVSTEGAGLALTEGVVENPNARSPKRIAVKLDKPVQKGAIVIKFQIAK